jgi:4-amino-4-deoxy-L-arabinose transferase-like glycosyltransferase
VLGFGLFLLFGHIEKLPLRQYDEARQAINAMEMVQSGNWLVTDCLAWIQAGRSTV